MASRAFYLLLTISLLLSFGLARGEQTIGGGSATELNETLSEQSQAKPAEIGVLGMNRPLPGVAAVADGNLAAETKRASNETGSSSTNAPPSTRRADEKKAHKEAQSGADSEKLSAGQEEAEKEKANAGSMTSTNATLLQKLRMEFFAKALPPLLNQTNTAFFLVRMPTEASERKSAETFIDLVKREMSQACIIEMQNEASLAKLLKEFDLVSLGK